MYGYWALNRLNTESEDSRALLELLLKILILNPFTVCSAPASVLSIKALRTAAS